MQSNVGVSLARCYGLQVMAWAEFVPAASPTTQVLVNAFGIVSIVRTAAGTWTVTLAEKFPGFIAIPSCVENDTTNLHEMQISSEDYTAGTLVLRHRTAAIGSLGSLAVSDTVDKVKLLVLGRPYT
jgi:hypothetical protein